MFIKALTATTPNIVIIGCATINATIINPNNIFATSLFAPLLMLVSQKMCPKNFPLSLPVGFLPLLILVQIHVHCLQDDSEDGCVVQDADAQDILRNHIHGIDHVNESCNGGYDRSNGNVGVLLFDICPEHGKQYGNVAGAFADLRNQLQLFLKVSKQFFHLFVISQKSFGLFLVLVQELLQFSFGVFFLRFHIVIIAQLHLDITVVLYQNDPKSEHSE